MTNVLCVVSSRVVPSGTARATASAAMKVLAPGRFSTMKLPLNAVCQCEASMRATWSTPPPAARAR